MLVTLWMGTSMRYTLHYNIGNRVQQHLSIVTTQK